MYKEPKIESSYRKNNLGFTLYHTIRMLKPKIVVDFGILYGYSTVAIAQALRDLDEGGKVLAYDLFENYKFKSASKEEVQYFIDKYEVQDYVELKEVDFYKWIDNPDDFDLLHLDISNTGSVIQLAYNKLPNKHIVFEGGSKERDDEEWVTKYNKTKMYPLQKSLNYKILNNAWPSISIMNNND